MKIKMELDGFDELQKELKKMQQAAQELEGKNTVSFDELFTDEFMKKHSTFSSLDEMLDKSTFTVNSKEDFAAIPDEEWDTYVKTTTDFSSWEDMMSEAQGEYVASKLNL